MSDPAPTSIPEVALFTDGACSGNPGPGGWAYILRSLPSGQEAVEYGGEPATTNNRMELLAVIEGLRRLKVPSRVSLYSDSQYVVKGLAEWIEGWKRRGWKRPKNKPVLNLDLWKELDQAREVHQITTHWVRGHDDHEENERCDRMAVQARDEAARGG
ncbi:MAG: ribonuclease HI [Phycisphaerales bacterium]|nr:ribonuclease HI [Phycisphaerales bacterium]